MRLRNVKNKEVITNRFNMNFAEGKNKLDMVITYTSNYSLNLVPYVNTGLTEKEIKVKNNQISVSGQCPVTLGPQACTERNRRGAAALSAE